MSLRCGITTGTCAAAAARAAVSILAGGPIPDEVAVVLPGGDSIRVAILRVWKHEDREAVTTAVRKDAGDDPDVTHGLEVLATVSWDDGADVALVAGEGVGTVTKPGLQVAPGQPAINPVPRQMIAQAIREVTQRGVRVEIAIPGGREAAARTFNPRLGIEGGLSILGTTGIVRPYCSRALYDALKCSLDVAAACGIVAPVLVPGHIGARAARRHFPLRSEQIIEIGNAWGFVLDRLSDYPFQDLLIVGHPGKLAKLAEGQWDTHSGCSAPAAASVARLCLECLHQAAPESPTVEGLFEGLALPARVRLAQELARRVRIRSSCPPGRTPGRGRVSGEHGGGSFGKRRRIAAMAVSPARIMIVGCGPGSERHVTPAARDAVAGADTLVGSQRLLALFPENAAERILFEGSISALVERMAELHARGRRLAVLVSGDPGLCSLGRRVIKRLGREKCEVIPGVSSVQMAFARLGLDWADVRILSAHGRTPDIPLEELGRCEKIAILAGTPEALRWSAAVAVALRASHVSYLAENLTLEDENFRLLTAEQLGTIEAASLSLVLLIRRTLLS